MFVNATMKMRDQLQNVRAKRIIPGTFVNLRISMAFLMTMTMTELPMLKIPMTITMELRISSNLNMLDLTRVLVKC